MEKFWAALGCGLVLCVGARADTSYPSVTGTVDGFSGSGTLYAASNGTGDGSYTVVGIDGPGVTGLIQAGSFHSNSNELYPGATPSLDANGFAFTDTMGDTAFDVALFSSNGGYAAHIVDSDGFTIDGAADFTLGSPVSQNRLLEEAVLHANDASGAGLEAFAFSFTAAQAVAATPEPGSFALMGTGLLGAAALVRRRARS